MCFPRYNESVVLMKTRRTITLAIAFILLFSLLLAGCGGEKYAEISDFYEDIAAPLPPTDEEPISPLSDEPSEGEDLLSDTPFTVTPPIEEGSDPPLEEEIEETLAPKEEPILSEYDTYLAACASTNVNVRSGAGRNYPLLFTLKKGSSLPYIEKAGEWIKVRTESGVGYLHGDYVYLAETTEMIERVIRAGLAKLGTPYEWGATRILTGAGNVSPYFTGKSFDCSSFVQYCYYVGCGIKLGNYTGSQADYTVGEKITSYADLRRGDFYFTGTGKISHVVIYLGGGYLLQTYSANGGPVSLTSDERWRMRFISGRRPDMTVTEQFR